VSSSVINSPLRTLHKNDKRHFTICFFFFFLLPTLSSPVHIFSSPAAIRMIFFFSFSGWDSFMPRSLHSSRYDGENVLSFFFLFTKGKP
jgi:hypothetical protein